MAFARDVLHAETMTPAGRVNLFGVFGLLLVVVGAGLVFDAEQAIVRIWKEHYSSGFPSFVSILRTYGFLFLGSVAMLTLGETISFRRR